MNTTDCALLFFLQQPSSSAADSSNNSGDGEVFEPTAEMLVNDFDDERTLDEEEAMEEADDQKNELSNLEKVLETKLFDYLFETMLQTPIFSATKYTTLESGSVQLLILFKFSMWYRMYYPIQDYYSE